MAGHSSKPVKRKSDGKEGNQKKKRLAPPTDKQKNALISYMESHSMYARGRLDAPNAAKLMKAMHERMAEKVNNSDPNGEKRDSAKWWKCWTDMKHYAKGVAATNVTKRTKTGGGGPDDTINSTDTAFGVDEEPDEGLTSNDENVDRIMNIIGWQSALGLKDVKDDLQSGPEDDDERKDSEDLKEPDDKENFLDNLDGPLSSSTPSAKRVKDTQGTNRVLSPSNSSVKTNVRRSLSIVSVTSSNLGSSVQEVPKCCCSKEIQDMKGEIQDMKRKLDTFINILQEASVTICVTDSAPLEVVNDPPENVSGPAQSGPPSEAMAGGATMDCGTVEQSVIAGPSKLQGDMNMPDLDASYSEFDPEDLLAQIY